MKPPLVEVITSVPIHKQRLKERGYNQAHLIAQSFAQAAQLPYFELLTKTHSTKSQAKTANKTERLTNLETVYELHPQIRYFTRPPHSVLIMDDVMTTGTTLNHCAQVLKNWGVQRVYGLTLAHGV